MMPRSKFRLRRRVWSKSCAELATAEGEGGVMGSAYMPNEADGKKGLDKLVKREKHVVRRKSGPTPRLKHGYEEYTDSAERRQNGFTESCTSAVFETQTSIPIPPDCGTEKHVRYSATVFEPKQTRWKRKDDVHWKAKVGRVRGVCVCGKREGEREREGGREGKLCVCGI